MSCFVLGDDALWEAVEDEWHDPRQVTTRDGYLVVRMDPAPSSSSGRSDGGGSNRYISGMVRMQSPFCLSGGFVEIGAILPGRDTLTTVYVSLFNSCPCVIPSEPRVFFLLFLSFPFKWSGSWSVENGTSLEKGTSLAQTLSLDMDIGLGGGGKICFCFPLSP